MGKSAVLISLGIVATIVVIFSLQDFDEVVHEEQNQDFVLRVHRKRNELQLGGPWCLLAPKLEKGVQLHIAKCSDSPAHSQHWEYDEASGLVQVVKHSDRSQRGSAASDGLCLNADYVSEPEGALLNLQPCDAASPHQAYVLDDTTNTMRLRRSPRLCLHSVDKSLKSGQPVLILNCPAKLNSNAEQFVGHTLTRKDQAFETTAMKEVLAEAKDLTHLAKHKQVVKHEAAAKPNAAKVKSNIEIETSDGMGTQAKSEERIHRIIMERRAKEKQVRDKMAAADAEVTRPGKSSQALLQKAKKVHLDGEQQLKAVAKAEQDKLRTMISTLEDNYRGTTEAAANKQKRLQKAAHDHSSLLQHRAKAKTTAVIQRAHKELRKVLNAVSTTLTDSVDQRQRARSKLVELRSKHADDVQLAQAALELAKVNQATHAANQQARKKARNAQTRAARSISFAKTILALRLKSIKTTEHLSADKAELHANAMITEAKEKLSRTQQTILMAVDDADDSTKLEEIVGSSGSGNVPSHNEDAQLDMEIDDVHAGDALEENLIDSHAAKLSNAAVDTIYTTKMHKCTFPFIYSGQKFYHCKASAQGHWCATHVDAAGAVKKWDYCVLNKHAIALAKQAAMEAAQLEIKRVLTATGAELTPAALRESLRAAAAVQTTSKAIPKDADKVTKASQKPDEEDLQSRHPVMGRMQAAQRVDQLINEREASPAM